MPRALALSKSNLSPTYKHELHSAIVHLFGDVPWRLELVADKSCTEES